jgi:hypothetical protein
MIVLSMQLRLFGKIVTLVVCLGLCVEQREAVLRDDTGHAHHEQEDPFTLLVAPPMPITTSGSFQPENRTDVGLTFEVQF